MYVLCNGGSCTVGNDYEFEYWICTSTFVNFALIFLFQNTFHNYKCGIFATQMNHVPFLSMTNRRLFRVNVASTNGLLFLSIQVLLWINLRFWFAPFLKSSFFILIILPFGKSHSWTSFTELKNWHTLTKMNWLYCWNSFRDDYLWIEETFQKGFHIFK